MMMAPELMINSDAKQNTNNDSFVVGDDGTAAAGSAVASAAVVVVVSLIDVMVWLRPFLLFFKKTIRLVDWSFSWSAHFSIWIFNRPFRKRCLLYFFVSIPMPKTERLTKSINVYMYVCVCLSRYIYVYYS